MSVRRQVQGVHVHAPPWIPSKKLPRNCVPFTVQLRRLQCFDAVGWAAGRASGL